jgi:fused signal recognition particle receptor
MIFTERSPKGLRVFESLQRNARALVERIEKTELNSEDLDLILSDFKLTLVRNDVALVVADEICERLKKGLVGTRVGRFSDKSSLVENVLRETLVEILRSTEEKQILPLVSEKAAKGETSVFVFVGVNGTGKTTTLAKFAHLLLEKGYSVVLACADTYRAGAIEQLQEHARRLGVRLIKRPYGSDAASVAYDAVSHAETRGINTVLIDTAGRMETNKNLMDEMAKIVRVVNPDFVIFVADALTGNDVVEQAREFDKSVGIDASILTKVDADAKGGAAVSITYLTSKPIAFLGVGQDYGDLYEFNPEVFVDQILG